jgi:hypothetical protein
LSAEALATFEALHFKRQSVGLTAAEEEQDALLAHAYERAILVRAKAAALLKERGHDISVLLEKPHD